MQKVVAFLDCANLSEAARDLCLKANHGHLLKNYLALNEEGRFLQAAYAYVPIDPRKEHASDSAIEKLWPAGYAVKSKLGAISAHAYKCNFDVEITMDIVKAIYDVKHDIAAIVSGDSDYAPLAMQLREMGICVETAAFRSSMSRQLPQRASGYICLDSYCTDYYSTEPRMERAEPSAAAEMLDALQAAENIAETGINESTSEPERFGSPAAGIMERAWGKRL